MWQLTHAVDSKSCRPLADVVAGLRRLTLLRYPAVKIGARLHNHSQQHLGVLGAAVLGALTYVNSGFMRIDPHAVGAVGNQIGLAGQFRHPEAVIGVRRQQGEVRWA